MKWNAVAARSWLEEMGYAHIEDFLFEEGGMLIYEARWGTAFLSKEKFIFALKRILCWEDDLISETIKELMQEDSKVIECQIKQQLKYS